MRALAAVAAACLLGLLLLGPAGAADKTVVLEGKNTRWVPGTPVTANPGDNLTFIVYNNDSFQHSILVSGHGVNRTLAGGTNTTFTFQASAAGTYYIYCAEPGHASDTNGDGIPDTNMAIQLIVGSPSRPAPGPELLLIVALVAAILIAVRVRRRA
jgi:plastocyanin